MLCLRHVADDAAEVGVVKADNDAIFGGPQVGLGSDANVPHRCERFEGVLRHVDPGAAVGLDVEIELRLSGSGRWGVERDRRHD